MKEDNYVYEQRPLWQWIVVYLLIAAVVYNLLYSLFIVKRGTYESNFAVENAQDNKTINVDQN